MKRRVLNFCIENFNMYDVIDEFEGLTQQLVAMIKGWD